MAVAVGSTSTLALGSARTTSTITAPASIANGDLLLAIVYAGDGGDLTPPTVTGPAGWTMVSGSPFRTYLTGDNFAIGLSVFWKIASSESGSYAFTHGSASTQAILYRLTGAHASAPISPTPTSNANPDNTPANVGRLATATGLTTSANDSLIIYAVGLWDGGPGTPPAGTTPTFTERLDSGAMYVADGVMATAGATGNKVNATVFTAQSVSSPWVALLIAVSPPSGTTAYSLTAAGGSYGFTGSPVGFLKGKRLAAAGGSYGFTGTTVTTGRGLIAAGGSYSFGGAPVSLIRSGAGGAIKIVTGQTVTAAVGQTLVDLPSPIYAWDAATFSGTGALSNHNQILTVPASATASSILSSRAHDPGKHTVETQFMGGNPVGRWGLYNAASNTGTLVVLETGAVLQLPAGTETPTFAPILDGDTLCCAYDGDTGEVWFRVNNGAWNNDLAQAPDSTGIGLWEPPTDVGYSGTLTTYAGPDPLKVEVDGTVIENLDIGYGFIDVRANNVTIRNCNLFATEFFGIETNAANTGTLIEYCTIGSGGRSAGILINGADFHIRNCLITGFENGIFPGSNGLIENCHIHSLSYNPDAHVDGIQFNSGHDVEINNCWIEAFDTSDIIIKADGAPIDNIRVEDCTLIGDTTTGEKTASAVYAYSVGTNLTTNVKLNRNRMEQGFDGSYLAENNSIPEAFNNIDYLTSERILTAYSGYSFPILPALAADSGLVHVPPVEPRGSSIALSGNYVGLSGDVFTATPVHRSHWLSPFSYVADAYVDKPAGVAENDILIVALYRVKPNFTLTAPVAFSPGWTQLGETQTFFDYGNYDGQCTIWWKRAGASEPSQYLWGFFEETSTQTYIGAYSGVTLAGAIDDFKQNGGFGLTATGLSVGATQDTDLLVYLEAGWAGLGNLTPPVGMTEIVDAVLYVAEETRTTLGPTGNRSHAQDPTDTAPPWLTTMITLRGA